MKLPASATISGASALLREIDRALASGDASVDASALETFDTSVIALLLEARRRAAAQGVSLAIAGVPEKLRSLASLYGVDDLLAPAPA